MSDSIQVKLLLFAKARELVGAKETQLTLSSKELPVSSILEQILQLYSVLQPIAENIVLAYNQEYKDSDDIITISPGDELAIIPPISGG